MNLLTAALRGLLRHPRRLACADCIACDFVDGRRHLIDRCRSLRDLQPLQLQAAAGLATDRAQLFGRTGHPFDRRRDVLHHRIQALLHLVHVHHYAIVSTRVQWHLNRQIALGDLTQDLRSNHGLSTQRSSDTTRHDDCNDDY
ncbi:hypothetical protein D3C85_340850 [compost metagenome]